MKTLILESDHKTRNYIKLAFQVGWPDAELILSNNTDDSITLIEKEYPDIVIIDDNSNSGCHSEYLKQIRLFSSVPVIVISGNKDELETIETLEAGADEFLIKPIGQMELLARIRAILRRQKPPKVELPLNYGPICLYPSSGRLTYHNNILALTRNESLVMLHLIKNAGNIVSYSSLADTLWGTEYPGSIEAIRVYINHLKIKIITNFHLENLILNKARLGYYLTNL